jgi:hypothetical protein
MAERMDLRDEDRLPWLETVEPDEEPSGGAGRTIALILLGLGLLAAIAGGIFLWQQSRTGDGDGTLIAAQEGDYKVRPDDPGGLKVEGEGDAAVATSAGGGAGNGSVDLKAVPEAPVAAGKTPAARPSPSAAPTRSASAAVPASGGRLVAADPTAPSRPKVPGAASGGAVVQLGAYPTEAAANAAWGGFAKRFGYLAALGKSVQQADVNGRKVFRLRVNAGSANQAADIVAKLRVAGEDSFVTS